MWTSTIDSLKRRPLTASVLAFAAVSGAWIGASYLFGKSPKQHATDTTLGPLDLTRIRDYSFELQNSFPKAPYIADFSNGKKHLYYIASDHPRGPENDTFRTIRHVVKNEKPQIVVIEGLQSVQGISPQWYQKHVLEKAAQNFSTTGEPEYAAYQAMQAGVPFIGAEPSEKEIFAKMATKGYSTKDMVAFYLLRWIPVWAKYEGLTQDSFEKKAQEFLDHFEIDHGDHGYKVPAEERPTVAEFKEWYAKHNNMPERSYLQIATQDFAPLHSANATYFQRMSAETGDIREQNIDAVIADAANSHDKVLVVYGSAHLMQSSEVFKNMFGKVELRKVTPEPGFAQKLEATRANGAEIAKS